MSFSLLYPEGYAHPDMAITYAVVGGLDPMAAVIDQVAAEISKSCGLTLSKIGNGDISTIIWLTLDDPNAGVPHGALGYSQLVVDGTDITRVILAADPQSWSYFIVVHEFLHGAGLKHPFDQPAGTVGAHLDTTVMDYHHLYGSSPTEMLAADKAALRLLYGWDSEVIGTDIEGAAGADTLTGGDGSDLLQGFNGPDLLQGGGWDDELRGGKGHDTLDGGTGDDTMFGGQGDDVFVLSAGDDVIADFGTGADSIAGSYTAVATDAGTELQHATGVTLLADFWGLA